MSDNKKANEYFSEDVAARRRDEVIHRMVNTPPRPKASSLPRKKEKKAGEDGAVRKVRAPRER